MEVIRVLRIASFFCHFFINSRKKATISHKAVILLQIIQNFMPFYFSQHSAPLLFGFLQGMIYAFLLLFRGFKKDRLADKLLGGVLLICSFHIAQYMLGFGGWYDSRDGYSSFMFYFPFHNFLLLGPLIYFYFRSLTNHQFFFTKRDIWHFLPWILSFSIYLFAFIGDFVFYKWWLGETFPGHDGTQGKLGIWQQGTVSVFVLWASITSLVVYTTFTIREFRRYKKYILDNFSETEGIEFNWLRTLLWAFIIGMGINGIFGFLQSFIAFSYAENWNSFFVIAVMIYFISIPGYSTTNQLPLLNFEPKKEDDKPEEKTAKLTPEINEWKKKIEAYMTNEQPYLNPNLTLKHLSQNLKTNTSILSKAINSGFNQNFNDFINAYRVRAVQEKLAIPEYQQFTLTSIAYECGFNSKATFNRAFKKFSGVSPKQFLEKV